MKNFIKCFLGVHNYEIIDTYELEDCNRKIGKVYVCKCNNCGKLKIFNVKTFTTF